MQIGINFVAALVGVGGFLLGYDVGIISGVLAMDSFNAFSAITVSMPYTARFYRNGDIEFECDWIPGSPVKWWVVPHGDNEHGDSPWFRLPRSPLRVFTIGDSRAGVWIINSGVYIDDSPFQNSVGAQPNDKSGSAGVKWLVLPVHHRNQYGA